MSRVWSKDWLPDTDYSIDDFCVVNDDIEYRCTTAHNSWAVFSDANWEVWVTQGALPLNSWNAITIDATNNINLWWWLSWHVQIETEVNDRVLFSLATDATRNDYADISMSWVGFGVELFDWVAGTRWSIYSEKSAISHRIESYIWVSVSWSVKTWLLFDAWVATTFRDDMLSKWIVYADDYSALWVLDPRWIPDYAAVTKKTFEAQTTVPIVSVSANITLTDTNWTVLVDATTSNVIITLLPAASFVGKIYTIKKIDSSANIVTIATNLTETIDGTITQVITSQRSSITVHSDWANRFII